MTKRKPKLSKADQRRAKEHLDFAPGLSKDGNSFYRPQPRLTVKKEKD